MACQFVFGDFASGKTEYVYNYLTVESERHPEMMFYMMVPEQNTLKAQQEIVRRHPRHGMLNIDVLSFNLMAYRVMEELGIKKPDIMDEVTKSMILRDISEGLSDKLLMYRTKTGKPGFIAQLKSIISEFYQYGVSEEDLVKAAENSKDNILKAKIHDICLIFSEFKNQIAGRYAAAEEIPYILLKNLSRSSIPEGAVFLFDGFAEYTPIQLKIIELIMDRARDVIFTITASRESDPYRRERGPLRAAELYYLSKEMTAKLTDAASRLGIKKAEDVWTGFKGQKTVEVFSCANPEEETRAVVSYIERLVREQNMRYRDVAVAAADMENYSELFKREFRSAGIPFFIDSKENADESAAVELIRTAVEVLSEGFSEETVLRYLKNPFSWSEALDEKKDLMDNYVRALGIRGKKAFEREWSYTIPGFDDINLKELNEFKAELLAPLFNLWEGLSAASVGEKAEALIGFICDSKLSERLSLYCERLLESGNEAEAGKQARILRSAISMIERLGGLMGGRTMSLSDFKDVLYAGFSELKVGSIPATLDEVIVGDLRRSRFEGIRVLIMPGVNDGIVPQTVTGGGILSDRERVLLLDEHIELAPADAEEGCIQRFHLKMNMEKPKDRLVVTFARTDRSGGSLKPSEIVGELSEESGLKVKDGRALMFIKSLGEALEYFSDGIRRESEGERLLKKKNMELYRLFLSEPETTAKADNILKAAFQALGSGGISERTARRLYGDILYGSVTRMESFNECAYKHFMRYGLELMERQQADIEASDIGNLYHEAIAMAFSLMKESGKAIEDMEDEELSELSSVCVDRVCSEYNNSIMQSSQRNNYITDKVKRITGRSLWAVSRQLKKGDFKVYGCELPFRYTSDGLSLKGRIDRVDRYEDDSRIYVKVTDYKSGKTKFDLSMVYQGLQLQLVSYMNVEIKNAAALSKQKQVIPGGIFYYNIDDPVIDSGELSPDPDREEVNAKIFEKLSGSGIVNADYDTPFHLDREQTSKEKKMSGADFEALLYLGEKRMKEAAAEILRGNTAIKPFRKGTATGCDYCPYHSICGFDPRLEDFSYRELGSYSEEELLKRISDEYREDEMD